jgi:hypothetical protein
MEKRFMADLSKKQVGMTSENPKNTPWSRLCKSVPSRTKRLVFSGKYSNLVWLLLVCGALIGGLAANRHTIGGSHQWDFRAHYFSTKAWEAGLNPYNNIDANKCNTTPYRIPAYHTYPYHFFTFNYFRIFTTLEYPYAMIVYMCFNMLLILFLIFIWKVFFLPKKVSVLLFAVTLLFSFNSTLFLGLNAGNTALFEAAMVWLAFVFFTKNKPLIFLLLILTIAFFKGTPLLLTPLVLLLPGKTKNMRPLVYFVLAAVMLWLSPVIFSPKLFADYWNYSSNVGETGIINPCSLALFTDFFRFLGWNSTWGIRFFYGIWGVFVLTIFGLVIRRLTWDSQRVEIVFLTILTYALIIPRFKDYAYIQILPAAYFLMTRSFGILLLNLFGLFSEGTKLPYLVKNYYPFAALVVNWGYLCYILWCGARFRKLESDTALLPTSIIDK